MDSIVLDVREKDEFDLERIENSIHIPLSEFKERAPAIFKVLPSQPIIFMCQSGKRANLAASEASRISGNLEVEVFEGGIVEWKRQGKPVVGKAKGLPIMRQVQLIAGLLVFSSTMLSYFFRVNFIWIATFVGAGLTFAGLTGFCGMAELLSKMPWNKSSTPHS